MRQLLLVQQRGRIPYLLFARQEHQDVAGRFPPGEHAAARAQGEADRAHSCLQQTAHQLPENSWLLETGGYKGTQNTITKPELYAQLETKFGVPSEHIINEYSMTELSSQFYTTGLSNVHQGPAWARVRIIHPVTGHEVAEGETGCIVIYDLANIDSVLAIQTQDLAIKHPNHTFQLIGRDPAALPKGCSIPADDFHQN